MLSVKERNVLTEFFYFDLELAIALSPNSMLGIDTYSKITVSAWRIHHRITGKATLVYFIENKNKIQYFIQTSSHSIQGILAALWHNKVKYEIIKQTPTYELKFFPLLISFKEQFVALSSRLWCSFLLFSFHFPFNFIFLNFISLLSFVVVSFAPLTDRDILQFRAYFLAHFLSKFPVRIPCSICFKLFG